MFANALMLPKFDYLDIIWSKTFKYRLKELDIRYKKAAKIALDVKLKEASIEVYKNIDWLPLHLKDNYTLVHTLASTGIVEERLKDLLLSQQSFGNPFIW